MGIQTSETCTDVMSNITCGQYTLLHARTRTIKGEMPQQKDIWRYAEKYLWTAHNKISTGITYKD